MTPPDERARASPDADDGHDAAIALLRLADIRCPSCGFNVRGAASLRCVECGQPFGAALTVGRLGSAPIRRLRTANRVQCALLLFLAATHGPIGLVLAIAMAPQLPEVIASHKGSLAALHLLVALAAVAVWVAVRRWATAGAGVASVAFDWIVWGIVAALLAVTGWPAGVAIRSGWWL